MRAARAQLAKKEPETADRETDAHQSEAGADPGQESSLGGKIDSRIFFCRLIHAGDCICPQTPWLRPVPDCSALSGCSRAVPRSTAASRETPYPGWTDRLAKSQDLARRAGWARKHWPARATRMSAPERGLQNG